METFRIEGKIFERLARLVPADYQRKIVSEFGTIAVNFSKERFITKDWKNQVSEKWTPRKRHARGSILVKSGRLKRSIRKMSSGLNYVVIGSDVPYAKIHNEGGRIQKTVYVRSHTRTRKTRGKRQKNIGETRVKSHTRKMNLNIPKRQFMGQSRALELRLQHHLKKSLTEQINRNI